MQLSRHECGCGAAKQVAGHRCDATALRFDCLTQILKAYFPSFCVFFPPLHRLLMSDLIVTAHYTLKELLDFKWDLNDSIQICFLLCVWTQAVLACLRRHFSVTEGDLLYGFMDFVWPIFYVLCFLLRANVVIIIPPEWSRNTELAQEVPLCSEDFKWNFKDVATHFHTWCVVALQLV